MVALVNSFDSPGFFARNIDDLILATSNFSLEGERERFSSIRTVF